MKIEAGGQISRAACNFPDRVAVTTQQGSVTYRELNELSNSIGSGLLQSGATRGDRVGVLAYNSIEVAQIWFGMEKWNLVRVVLHSHFDFSIHVKTLNHVGASTLVFDTRFANVIAEHRSSLTSVKLFVAIGSDVPE